MSSSETEPPPRWKKRLLDRDHHRNEFRCGEPTLDSFLVKHARLNGTKDLIKTYVVSPGTDANRVAGYYTLVVGQVEVIGLPPSLAKGLPSYAVPVMLLARLAVDDAFKGQGLGETMLLDAFQKARSIADGVGLYAIRVDAISDSARAFYEKYGFVGTVDLPLTLFLSMKVVRETLDLPFR